MPCAYTEETNNRLSTWMAHKRRRRKNLSLAEVLIESDWRVSLVLALAVWLAISFLLPSMAGNSPLLSTLVSALQGNVWIPVSVLCVIALVSFLRTARDAAVDVSLPDIRTSRISEAKEDRPPPAAVKREVPARRDPVVPQPDATVSEPLPMSPLVSSPVPADWSLDLIRNIEWKRFEDVCERYYALKGMRSSTTPLGADGGIDIRLFQEDGSERVTTVIQCKAWGDRLVGVKPVRELLGVKVHEKADKAFFMTSGGYTEEARAFASANGITLMGGDMLLMMFRRLPDDMSAALLAFATAGDYCTPTCPSCGVKMTARRGKGDGRSFWGCVRYPRCRQTMPMRTA